MSLMSTHDVFNWQIWVIIELETNCYTLLYFTSSECIKNNVTLAVATTLQNLTSIFPAWRIFKSKLFFDGFCFLIILIVVSWQISVFSLTSMYSLPLLLLAHQIKVKNLGESSKIEKQMNNINKIIFSLLYWFPCSPNTKNLILQRIGKAEVFWLPNVKYLISVYFSDQTVLDQWSDWGNWTGN